MPFPTHFNPNEWGISVIKKQITKGTLILSHQMFSSVFCNLETYNPYCGLV